MNYVDLHSHTTESDGTFAPEQLVDEAIRVGLSALAITDHDTFAGYEKALPAAMARNLRLVRGIELNSRLDGRPAHILGYFPNSEPTAQFADWITSQQAERRSRNQRLAASLQTRGIDVTLEEVEALGRSLAGRPHFAKILVKKGYAKDSNDAFRRYIGETAPAYVARQSFTTAEVIRAIRDGGGMPVIAHPIRLSISDPVQERACLAELKDAGLTGLEVIHSEQGPELQQHYANIASDLRLLPSGGSDFHGAIKPDIELGSGRNGNVRVPESFLDGLSAAAR